MYKVKKLGYQEVLKCTRICANQKQTLGQLGQLVNNYTAITQPVDSSAVNSLNNHKH